MNNNELNEWAHKFVGGCNHEFSVFYTVGSHEYCWQCKHCGLETKDERDLKVDVPNYCNDLNLARLVEVKIPQNKRSWYIEMLEDELFEDPDAHRGDWIWTAEPWIWTTATAEQRVRAAHKTMKGI